MAGWIDLADLIRATHNVGAEMNAFPCAQRVRLAAKAPFAVLVGGALALGVGHLPLGLAAHLQIARIAKVAIGTDAQRPMVVGHTERVRAALNLRAGIDALAQTLAQLEADLRVAAVGVVAALPAYAAALAQVVRIAHVAQRAEAFARITNGARSTRRIRA